VSTNLWWATEHPDISIENLNRAVRVYAYLENTTLPVMYKDIRRDLGCSYWQTVRAVGLLVRWGSVHVTVTTEWNGMHYIYPRRIWITNPRNL
jgi:hypothetical protein